MSNDGPDGGGLLLELKARHEDEGSIAESVYQVLKDAIMLSYLKPGERLREEELAKNLETSRTPVREALGRLQVESLVSMVPRKGLIVTELALDEVYDIYAVREVLEGTAARWASKNAHPTDLILLEGLLEQMARDIDSEDVIALTLHNAEFHNRIAQAAKSRQLLQFVSLLHNSVQRLKSTTFSVPGRMKEAHNEHTQVLNAILQADEDGAERLAREHMSNALQARLVLYQSVQQGE